MNFCEPNKNEFQNYVWDTQALNQLAIDKEMIACCKRAIINGHRYYITTVQERELEGVPDRKMSYEDLTTWNEPQTHTFEIMDVLGFCRLSCIALLYPDFFILDGSMRFLEGAGSRVDMFYDIYNDNDRHKRDATIAEAAVFHDCTLITNDGRLRKKVNNWFPGSAITYEEYKNLI